MYEDFYVTNYHYHRGSNDQTIGKGGHFYAKHNFFGQPASEFGTGSEMCYTYASNAGGIRTFVIPKSTNNTCNYTSVGAFKAA